MLQLMLHHRNTQSFRPLSGSYISQYFISCVCLLFIFVSVPYRGATFLNQRPQQSMHCLVQVSVPYRGATFLNIQVKAVNVIPEKVSVPYRGATFLNQLTLFQKKRQKCFRPLSGSYISQYHLRNPMSCLGRIGGLRGKSNFIEMQPFWKVKNSHKSNI